MKNQILERNNIMEESEALLQKSNQDLKQQSLLKSQISAITDLTQGASELKLLTDKIISKLADMTHSGFGVLYLRNFEENKLELELMPLTKEKNSLKS